MPGALHDQAGASLQERRRGAGQQVESLLGVESADHADDRSTVLGVEAVAGQQIGPAGGLPGTVGAVVWRGEIRIRPRIPDRGVQPVEDPDESVPARAQQPVEPHPEGRRERLGRVPG